VLRTAVIGSGPAGIACAKALIRRGLKVEIIDAGDRLPAPQEALKDRLARQQPTEWSDADIAAATANPTMQGNGFPQKYLFGSDALTGAEKAAAPVDIDWPLRTQSFAAGGFSVAWGAAMLPIQPCDMENWPIAHADLEPSFTRVMGELPLSARPDGLSEQFPLYGAKAEPVPLPQALRAFAADLEKARQPGLVFGQARLAVRRDDDAFGRGCQLCGLCLSGCPYGAIHTMLHELDRLRASDAVRYRDGLLCTEVAETGTSVAVRLMDLAQGTSHQESFDFVFVAAGAVGSLRIALESLLGFDEPVLVKDSQKFILPLARWRAQKVDWPRALALPGLFLDYKAADLSDHWVHAQISAMNGYVLDRLGAGAAAPAWRRRLLRPVAERLLVAWCGLHSDHSSAIEARLLPTNSRPSLKLTARLNPETSRAIRRASSRLARLVRRARTTAVLPMLQTAPIGGGSHLGGSLPMRERPTSRFETDPLGRLAAWRRVHFVDSSVLPSIPATTLGLTIMANADRIASSAPLSQ
jgi:choline dehydrogenase-like flavoprotein